MQKRNRIIYWIATIWLCLGLASTGIVQLMHQPTGAGGADSMAHLGYPRYLLTWLGILKLVAIIVLLIPKFQVMKEWAYAGCFFLMTGAIFSHFAAHDTIKEIFPAILLLLLTLVSYFFRPEQRKTIAFTH